MLTWVATMSLIHLLVPGCFVPVDYSMQLPIVSEMQCTIPTFLLVFVGNIFILLVSVLFMECKLHDMQTQAPCTEVIATMSK